jgi:REP element-mobilizing transposase RayT
MRKPLQQARAPLPIPHSHSYDLKLSACLLRLGYPRGSTTRGLTTSPPEIKIRPKCERHRVSRRRPVQLTFDDVRVPTGHGGWRPHAGRPRGKERVGHEARESIPSSVPQHITLRVLDGLPSLRKRPFIVAIRDAITRSHRVDFRIVHFSIEANHLHLITESAHDLARSAGLQAFEVRVARSINRIARRRGTVFADRYHCRPLRTPREVRNALRYVLNNALHHMPSLADDPTWFDPCSSAAWFDGWAEPLPMDSWWKRELATMPNPCAPATVWLLRVGWRRHGLLRIGERPK